jgi:hypothetical protein
MAVVWQMAGKFRPGMLEQVHAEFRRLRPLFESTPGFLRAQIFANETSRQLQLLTFWDSYETSVAFFKGSGPDLMKPFSPYVEDMGTVVCSAVTYEFNRGAPALAPAES